MVNMARDTRKDEGEKESSFCLMTSFIHSFAIRHPKFFIDQSNFESLKCGYSGLKSYDCSWFTLSERNKYSYKQKSFTDQFSDCHFDLINCIETITHFELLKCRIYLCGYRRDQTQTRAHSQWNVELNVFNIVKYWLVCTYTAVCLAWHRLKNQFTLKWTPHFSNAPKKQFTNVEERKRAARVLAKNLLVLEACNCAGTGNFSPAKHLFFF